MIVLLSLAVRAVYFVQLNEGPCVWLHRWAVSDMNFFDTWARTIAAGDWLTGRALHPYHDWHATIAQSHFGTSDMTAEQGRALWDHWYGGKRFHQEPLYAYFIAAIYWLIGPDPRCVFVVQTILGILNNVLIYTLARRWFGDVAGWIAGLAAVFCGPLLFYELVLLRPTMTVFFALVSALLVDRASRSSHWAWWLLTGSTLGLALLLRATFVLFAGGVVGVLIVGHARRPAALCRCLLPLLGGVALGIAPAVARNVAVGVSPFAFNSVGAVTFVMANTVDYPPMAGGFVSWEHTPRIMADSDGHFLPTVWTTLATHPNVWSYVRLLGGKLAAALHWYERPNNVNFYYFRWHAPVLRWAAVSFTLVAPLGLAGALLALRRLRTTWPLHLMALTLLLALLILYVISRFRAPLLAVLLPFAGFAVVELVRWVRLRRFLPAAGTIVAVALLALWIARPTPDGQTPIRPVDYLVPEDIYYLPAEQAAREAGDWPRTARTLEQALHFAPPIVHELGPGRPAGDETEAQLASWAAGLHRRWAEALRHTGQPAEADVQIRRAVQLEQAGG
ncbi:MAG: glycosyltransferase family 39 protein [Phycisphaerae bacterium]